MAKKKYSLDEMVYEKKVNFVIYFLCLTGLGNVASNFFGSIGHKSESVNLSEGTKRELYISVNSEEELINKVYNKVYHDNISKILKVVPISEQDNKDIKNGNVEYFDYAAMAENILEYDEELAVTYKFCIMADYFNKNGDPNMAINRISDLYDEIHKKIIGDTEQKYSIPESEKKMFEGAVNYYSFLLLYWNGNQSEFIEKTREQIAKTTCEKTGSNVYVDMYGTEYRVNTKQQGVK